MIRILLLVLIGLLFITFATLIEGSRIEEVKSKVNECEVIDYQRHNAFYRVGLSCPYDDGKIVGVVKRNLYVSQRGRVLK